MVFRKSPKSMLYFKWMIILALLMVLELMCILGIGIRGLYSMISGYGMIFSFVTILNVRMIIITYLPNLLMVKVFKLISPKLMQLWCFNMLNAFIAKNLTIAFLLLIYSIKLSALYNHKLFLMICTLKFISFNEYFLSALYIVAAQTVLHQ